MNQLFCIISFKYGIRIFIESVEFWWLLQERFWINAIVMVKRKYIRKGWVSEDQLLHPLRLVPDFLSWNFFKYKKYIFADLLFVTNLTQSFFIILTAASLPPFTHTTYTNANTLLISVQYWISLLTGLTMQTAKTVLFF